MFDQESGLTGAAGRRRAASRIPVTDIDRGPFPGRHASRSEIAAETPIFHALTVGGWRSRQHEAAAPAAPPVRPAPPVRSAPPVDPLVAFRRDPLTAPIPVQALVPAPSREPVQRVRRSEGAHAMPERPGRHRQLTAVRAGAGHDW